MEEILVFQNDPLVGPGTFHEHLTTCGLDYRCVRLFDGEVPDSRWDQVRALIVLGGHMSMDDELRYPYLRWEKTILRMAIKRGLVMLGISLGAQLIAYAAGAKAYPGRFKEIGWYPISLTAEGQFDPLTGRLPETAMVFQWNVGGVELPSAALRLASSSYFKNAAFRLGRRIYGLNFHLETTPQLIEEVLDGIPTKTDGVSRRAYPRKSGFHRGSFRGLQERGAAGCTFSRARSLFRAR